MPITTFFVRAASALLLLTVAAEPALAQARAERPFRGLFRGGMGTAQQEVIVYGSTGGGYDTNLVADAQATDSASDFNTEFRGGLGTTSGGIQYQLSKERVQFGAVAGTSARYYPSLETSFVRRDMVSLSAGAALMRGLTATAYGSYLPYSLLTAFPTTIDPGPGEVAEPDFEFASSAEHYVSYGGGLGYSYNLSRRTQLVADYTHQSSHSSESANRFDSDSAGAVIRHGLSRDLVLRMGYHYADARYTTVTHARHVIDAGVNYDKNLSISRRTSIAFDTGTTATTRPGVEENSILYRLTGSARLRHEFGRTWTTGIAYDRGLHFYDQWPEPVASDSITAHLDGLFNRHLEFRASARTSRGRSGFETGNNDFDAYNGRVTLGYGISRYVSMGVAYTYYRHRFDEGVQVAPGFSNQVNRHSVHVALQVWAPVYQSRARRVNATR